jgi:hypothetical protein
VPARWQPSIEDYIDIAAYLLGADRAAIVGLPRITLRRMRGVDDGYPPHG